MSQALVKIEDVASRPLVNVEDLRRTFEALKGQANILSPISAINHVKPLHQISIRLVTIDPQAECYQDKRFCGEGEYAIGGVGLQKLIAAAGAQVIYKKRLDDRSDPLYCEMEMCLAVQDFDGTWRQIVQSKALDLREGSEDAKSMKPMELANQRRNIVSMTETKALYRCVRKLFAVRQKYSKAELARPWIVPKLVPHLDLNDPEQKTAAIKDALSTSRALYGPPPDETRELKDATPRPALATGPTSAPDQEQRREPAHEMPAADEPGDFDMIDLASTPVAPKLCGCPCGHQVEVTEEVARLTTDQVGGIRCAACAPGRGFDFPRHKELRTLNYPKYPNVTADDVQRKLDEQAKAKAGAAKR